MSNNEADRLAEQIKQLLRRPGGVEEHVTHGLLDQLATLAKQQAPEATAEPVAVPVVHPNVINALKKERDGWHEEATNLAKQLRIAQVDLDMRREHQAKDVWYWQGDGEDHVESMGNRMLVAIYASDLRAALAAHGTQKAEANQAELWTRCVFEGAPPTGYASWHEWINAPVKALATITATCAEATQAAAGGAKCSQCGSTTAMECNGMGCFALEGQDTPPSTAQSPEQQAQAEPMSYDTLVNLWRQAHSAHKSEYSIDWYNAGVRDAEKHHGILAEAGIKDKT